MSNLTNFIKGLNICLSYIVNEVDTISKDTHTIKLEEANPFLSQEIKELEELGFEIDEKKGILYFKEK